MNWYHYDQNNSGGFFSLDDNLAPHVFIEAENLDKANEKAESIGIYFHGVSEGLDCDCCGDRWHSPWGPMEESPLEYIKKYGKYHYNWEDIMYILHYANGTVGRLI